MMIFMNEAKPTELGFYRVSLHPESELAKILGQTTTFARFVQKTNGDGVVRRFFDLPRPKKGITAWQLLEPVEETKT